MQFIFDIENRVQGTLFNLISELEIYKDSVKKPYTLDDINAYANRQNGLPYFWTERDGNRGTSRLQINDGNVATYTMPLGDANLPLNIGDWTRFLFETSDNEIPNLAKLSTLANYGGYKVSIYLVTGTYNKLTHLNARSNDGLFKLGELTIGDVPVASTFNIPLRFQSFFVSHGGKIKKFDGTNWIDTGLTNPMEPDFKTLGMLDLTSIPQDKWTEVAGGEILAYTTDSSQTAMNMDYNIVPFKPFDLLPQNFEVVTWTDKGGPTTLGLTVEPFKPFDKLPNTFGIESYVEGTDSANLIISTEPYKLINKFSDNAKLLCLSPKEINLQTTVPPYKPIDKLPTNFEIATFSATPSTLSSSVKITTQPFKPIDLLPNEFNVTTKSESQPTLKLEGTFSILESLGDFELLTWTDETANLNLFLTNSPFKPINYLKERGDFEVLTLKTE